MPNTITITDLRNTIATMCVGQATVHNVATELGTSPRTLQRRISELGVTFSNLVDEVRYIYDTSPVHGYQLRYRIKKPVPK